MTGCECALSLAKQGKNVTLVDMIDENEFGRGGAKFNQVALMGLVKDANVQCIKNVTLSATNETIAFVKNNEPLDICYDTIVLSLGVRPDQDLLSQFEDCASDVIYIGDCNTRVGTLFNAIHTAHEAASII